MKKIVAVALASMLLTSALSGGMVQGRQVYAQGVSDSDIVYQQQTVAEEAEEAKEDAVEAEAVENALEAAVEAAAEVAEESEAEEAATEADIEQTEEAVVISGSDEVVRSQSDIAVSAADIAVDAQLLYADNGEGVADEDALKEAFLNGVDVTLTADIDLTATLVLTSGKAVTLDLNGHTLRGNASDSVINVKSGGSLTVCDSVGGGKITGGKAQYGGGIYNQGTLTLKSGTVCSNEGGGIYSEGRLVMEGGTVSDNIGIGIYAQCKNTVITGGTVSNNVVSGHGAGIEFGYGSSDDTVIIKNLTVGGNKASGAGGGIFFDGVGHTLNLINCTFTGNEADFAGGVYMRDGKALNVSGCTFSNNKTNGSGAGIWAHGSSTVVTVDNSTFANNKAGYGGGISAEEVVFNSGKVYGNYVRGFRADGMSVGGAGIHCYKFTMNGGEIYGNSTDESGGGVQSEYYGVYINGGKIYGNTAKVGGADISGYVQSIVPTTGFGTLNGKEISGWFVDNRGCRWQPEAEDFYVELAENGGIGYYELRAAYMAYKIEFDPGEGILPDAPVVSNDKADDEYYDDYYDDDYYDDDYYEDEQPEVKLYFKTVAEGDAVSAPTAPIREGYDFLGWYRDGVEYDFSAPVTENITLTAQWREVTPDEDGVPTTQDDGIPVAKEDEEDTGDKGESGDRAPRTGESTTETPRTGDESGTALMLSVMSLSAVGLAGVSIAAVKKRKKHAE